MHSCSNQEEICSAEFLIVHNRCSLHFAWVVDDAKLLWSRASVCLSAAERLHYCTDPDVTRGRGRGCPLVVHYWADLQSVHRLRCYGNITQTLVTSLRPSCVIWRHSANARRGLRTQLAGDCRVTGAFWKLPSVYGKWACLAGRWLAIDGGVLNITAVAWTAGFHWWRSGNITRTQNVSEYMLVLALCLVQLVIMSVIGSGYSNLIFCWSESKFLDWLL